MEIDARTAAHAEPLEADVCIVGAGPAGLALAGELQDRGHQVVLLESGDPAWAAETEALNVGETAGDPYAELHSQRHRGIGGTTGVWNTIIDGAVFGKYVPLDAGDFEPRTWCPWSGWPFGPATLGPWQARAASLAGLPMPDFTASGGRDPECPPLDLAGSRLVNTVYRLGSAERFTIALPRRLAASTTTRLVRGATMTEVLWNPRRDRVTAVRWRSHAGETAIVHAGRFVLAAGGVENARLLLLAGIDRDWVGRGFMDHPVDHSLTLISREPALQRAPTFYSTRRIAGGGMVMGRIAFGAELLRSERLLNAALRLTSDEGPALLRSPGLRPWARRLVPFPALRRRIGQAVRRIAGAAGPDRGGRYPLRLDLEMAPHRDNRVVLSSRRDHLGLPRALLHWHWRPEDQANLERVRAVAARELEAAGAGRVEIAPDGRLNPAYHHHSGTTRMHADPAEGVVDPDLRVHGVENLFVTGSSVFPTAGVANPTLTVLALSLRLADHLAPPA